MNAPLVSVIIDNYNYGRFLGDAIESVLNQTYSPIELIVVDDGSTDDSIDVIQRYGDRLISILKSNGGQASAFNAGFEASSGDLICFLDADDIMAENRVERTVELLTQHPAAQWSYHCLALMDEVGQPIDPSQHAVQATGETYPFDVREDIRRGSLNTLPFPLPGIVGLTFRRSHLARILPMPQGEGISVNDSYVQFASCAISPGVARSEKLETQRIHGKNSYTLRHNRAQLEARILILTAHWLRIHFPGINCFSRNLLAVGLSFCWKAGGIEPQCRELVKKHLSVLSWRDRLSVMIRSFYRYLTS